MAVNARTEEFQHIEVFDKPALFTNGRIARDTVPKGWYCYDIRGSDDDPGELCYMEENVVVNHAGSVLMPEKLAMPKSGRLDVRDEVGFLDEGDMTLREFCEAHQLPYPAENMKFHIRPARPEEAGLFYAQHPEEDKRLGAVGHVRMDFGRSGNEFWHTWWPRGPEELNSPVFKKELQEVVDTLRESVLKNRFATSARNGYWPPRCRNFPGTGVSAEQTSSGRRDDIFPRTSGTMPRSPSEVTPPYWMAS